MNKVILMGRLTADPEFRQTQSGISSCRFRVAVNRNYVDKNTGERQADFINCIAWAQTAEFVSKYFNKGNMIMVEGTLRTGSYQDRNYPDVTHYTTDVNVDNVEFTGSKREMNGGSSYSGQQDGNYGGYGNYGGGGYSNRSGGSYGSQQGEQPRKSGYGNANGSSYNSQSGGYDNASGSSYGAQSEPRRGNYDNANGNSGDSMSYGNFSDFEDVISEDNVPF